MSKDNESKKHLDRLSRVAKKDLSDIFPGKDVAINEKLTVKIWPPGVIHIQEFSKVLYKLAEMVLTTPLPMKEVAGKQELTKDAISGLVKIVVPIVLTDLFELLQQCTDVDLADPRLPHFVLPTVAEAWVQESFFKEESFRPWMQAIETILEKITGQKTNLSDIWSRFSSLAGSLTKTSSADTSKGSLIQDGLSGSLLTTPAEPKS